MYGGAGHVSPSQRYKASQEQGQSRRPHGAAVSTVTKAAGKGAARSKSYSEIAAQRARKAQSTSQSQSQQHQQQQQPARGAVQSQSPQGVVTKYRDITDIPDRHGPIRFHESDDERDQDSLEDAHDAEDDLRRSGFHQRNGSDEQYDDDDYNGRNYDDDEDDSEDDYYQPAQQPHQHQRLQQQHHHHRSQPQPHMHATHGQRRSHDKYSGDAEDDIDAQISRLQSQIAGYDSHHDALARDHNQVNGTQAHLAQAKPMTQKEMLVYSKKARPVEFKPYTLKEYQKKHKPTGYYEVGSLQPDLNTEELKAKRENMQRVKEFSKQLRQFNARAAPVRPLAHDSQDVAKEPSTRDKALEFAKSIPKPKVKSKPERKQAERGGRIPEEDPTEDDVVLVRSKLDELEVEHAMARKQVEAIKRSLGF